MGKYAKSTAAQIRKRTRLGWLIGANGQKTYKKKLSKNYVLQRKGKLAFRTGSHGRVYAIETLTNNEIKSYSIGTKGRKQNNRNRKFLRENKPKLDPTTRPGKSNLTVSGELLRSIRGKGASPGRGLVYLKGMRNNEIASWQARKGRRFLHLSRQEINKLTRQIASDLERYMKRKLR